MQCVRLGFRNLRKNRKVADLVFLFSFSFIGDYRFPLLYVIIFFHPVGFRERVDQGLSHQTTDLSVLLQGILVYES